MTVDVTLEEPYGMVDVDAHGTGKPFFEPHPYAVVIDDEPWKGDI